MAWMTGIWVVGLKLAVVSLLWQDLCLLLVWVRAPSLGRDVTLPEGLHSLMDSNGHSPYTKPLGNGTWRTVEWQVRCQELGAWCGICRARDGS